MHRLLTTTLATVLLLGGLSVTSSSTAAPPGAVVEISGAGVSVYPAYDETVTRYGIRTTIETAGRIDVRVEAAAGSVIRVNGELLGSGVTRTMAGLASGDEVNVQVSAGGTTSNQSWIYLPDGFPRIDTVSTGEGPVPGLTAMTLQAPGSDSYPTLVDRNGVPTYVSRRGTITSDLNRQPNGHYSLAVAVTQDLWGDYVVEEYDEQFRKVASHRMLGQPKTDFHDAILLPGGGRILMAYIKAPDGQTDSWLQEVSPTGEVLLDWNSRDHVLRPDDVIENALGDYAHLNSMQVMSDGNLLLSFRHLNQVMKINRVTGDVMWRLGGRRSDFTFDDDPWGGPCAQHTARELANGDIQVFDNGSAPGPTPSNPLCPDPADPAGATVYRPHSRVAVYHLEPGAGTTPGVASLVGEAEAGVFSQFAGGAERLGAGTVEDHVFVGLNNAEQLDPPVYGTGEAPDAVELAADGSVVWTLTAPGFATYRATKLDAPDRIAPAVRVAYPTDGVTVPQGHGLVADFQCSDTGGSNLTDCVGGVADGAALSNDVGTHQLVVRASDGNGNATTRTVTYHVVAPAAPVTQAPSARADATIRKAGGRWKGDQVYSVADQTVTYRARGGREVRAQVRIRNSGTAAARLTLDARTRGRGVDARWFVGTRDVTRKVRRGTYRTDRLEPGRSVRLRLVIAVGPRATRGDRVVRLSAQAPGTGRDVVRARLRSR